MAIEVSRRGFFAGLFGTAVIAILPKPALALATDPVVIPAIDPWAIKAPDGIIYQWVRTALLGVPDPANVAARLDNGWLFVAPSIHPGAPVSTVERAIEACGLILMEKPTVEVVKALQAEREAMGKRWPHLSGLPK